MQKNAWLTWPAPTSTACCIDVPRFAREDNMVAAKLDIDSTS